MVCEPEADLVPDQPLPALQDTALVDNQDKVTELPEAMEIGPSESDPVERPTRETVGANG